MGGGAIAMLVVVTTYGAEVVEGKTPTIKPLLAGGVLGLMLTIVGSISPRVGNAFGVLVIVAALATNGADALRGLGLVADHPAAGTIAPSGGGNWSTTPPAKRATAPLPSRRGTGSTGPIETT